MKPKSFNVCLYKGDIKKFNTAVQRGNTNKFFDEYIEDYSSNGVSNKEDILSLLLITSVALRDVPSIKIILKHLDNPIALTTVDQQGFSAISSALSSGAQSILELIHIYLHNNVQAPYKVECVGVDRDKILKLLECPQFEDLDTNTCMDDYLSFLYSKDSLDSLVGELNDY